MHLAPSRGRGRAPLEFRAAAVRTRCDPVWGTETRRYFMTELIPRRQPAWRAPMGALVAAISLALTGLSSQAQVQTAQMLQQYQSQGAQQQSQPAITSGGDASSQDMSGPVRLRQNNASQTNNNPNGSLGFRNAREQDKPYRPGEFELFVNKLANTLPVLAPDGKITLDDTSVRRFGAELVTPELAGDYAADFMPQVPQDYLITPGDEIALTIWGSVDADLRLTVDRAGRLNIPRVGSVLVAGVRYGDLPSLLNQRVAQVFRNFQLSVSLGQLRSIRIYVTGFTTKPGSYTVSSLSTVVNGLMRAGGPSAAGTFRNIELRRAGKLVSTLDLYDLLIKGDRTGDRVLQPEDVIHIGAVGTQTAVIGSVNKPAIFELKKGETVDDVLRMAGGLTAVADRGRLSVERLDERIGARVAQLRLPEDLKQTPANGDVLRAFSAVEATLPQDKQNKRVRIEGEVARPGDYILPPNSSITDAIRVAGGLTPNAYVFGTEFSRESVRQTQQENYERALRDLETEFAKRTSTQRALSADEAAVQASQGSAATRLIERLRAVRPTGRIVLQLDPVSAQLPELAIESGDRIYVPAVPTTVGVFGSVFNGGSYLYSSERKVTDYVKLAGGTTRGADDGSAFVLRANGSVVSARQSSGFFSSGNLNVPALPGDTVFVPEELNKTTFIQAAKEWTQILYQFGLGAAALKTIRE